MSATMPSYDIVIPSLGRPQLADLLAALDRNAEPPPSRIVVVDDRAGADAAPIEVGAAGRLAGRVRVIASGGRGPAAARNVGWRACRAEWIVFLDDDVVPTPGWGGDLVSDLSVVDPSVAGVQARIAVPLPADRLPTDWERNVAGLASSSWITADMAYRSSALAAVDGFDERFPRAYREDADLALRVTGAGFRVVEGRRRTLHPVRPGRHLDAVRRQAGNTDDVTMWLLHGKGWRLRAGAGTGRRPLHLATTSAAATALACWSAGRRPGAVAAAAAWAALTGEFAWRRIAPGPRTPGEVLGLLATSILIPPAATYYWLVGWATAFPRLSRRPIPRGPGDVLTGPVEAVLFDRDGTLIEDVPYNADPDRVHPVPGARELLDRLRGAGVKVGIVSNQSAIGRGLATAEQVRAVNRRVEDLLGPFDAVVLCPHTPEEGCRCRKPEPGMIEGALEQMGVVPERCVVVGDIGSDVEAARRAGASHILVPTPRTLAEEVVAAGTIAADLRAVEDLLRPHLDGVAA